MRYLDKRFSTPANSRAFVDNWDAIFGSEEKPPATENSNEKPPETGPTDGSEAPR
jgi:hypothetical protein